MPPNTNFINMYIYIFSKYPVSLNCLFGDVGYIKQLIYCSYTLKQYII